jgi:pilus assembly protein FimV
MNLRKIAVQLLIVLILVTAIPAANSQQGNLRGPKSATPKYVEPQLQFQGGIRSSIYGPIVSSDTLWQISQNYRPNNSLSIYQVMQAIFELNPDAFEQQNINFLKNGSMLTMPSENYISGINKKQAQQKSELDSQNLQTKTSKQPPLQTKNSTSLEQTRELIDKKLLAIDESQNRQFLAIREQFSESITSVQNILDENKRLFERLDKVNTDIDDMRSEEQQKSLQMNQMGKSIEELLDKSRQDDAKKAAQLAQKNTSWFDSPIIIISLFTLPALLALTAFAYWMIKRKSLAVLKPKDDDIDDFSFDPISAETDDLSDALSAELSGKSNDYLDDDNLFDDLPDDVLSEELEEAFDEEAKSDIEEPLVEAFDDLGDEGLKEEFEIGAGVVEQDDLDNLFAEDDDMSTEVQDNDINSELGNVSVENDEQNADNSESEEDDSLLAPIESEVEKIIDPVVIDEEQPEISIDELLDESIDKSVENPLIDDSEDINEDVLQNLDKEIALQNEELDSITGSLIDELEQIEQMSSMIPDDDDESPEGEESQLDIQKLDDLREEIDEFGEEDKDDEIEIDISEVLNETLQSAASEELAEPESATESKESVELESTAEVEESVEPESTTQAEESVEPDPTTEAKESVELESTAEVEESVEPESTTQAEESVEPDPTTEAKESVEPESAVEAETSVESESTAESETSVEPDPTTEAKESVEPESAVEAETSVESESTAESETSVEPESAVEAETSVESESTAESETSVESEPTAESETSVESESTAESETSVESESTAESEASVESEPTAESETLVDSESTAEGEETVEPEQAAEAEAPVEPESTAESEASVESEPTAESETLVDSESTAEGEETVEPEQAAEAPVEPESGVEAEESVEPDEMTEAEDSDESEPQTDDNIDEEDLFDTELSLEKDFEVPANSDTTLDEDQLEKALEDFEKEELDDVLEDLTSNVSAPISSLDDLKFSANDFVTKNQTSQPAPLPTLDGFETIEDFDDSELDNAFDEDFGEESFESSPSRRDDLDDLPGLGEWLDEGIVKPDDKQLETFLGKDVIEELEDSSFDEMLESIDFDNELSEAGEEDTGFDITALLDESHQSKDLDINEQDAEDFLDVESLLNDSVSAESDDEIDKALDLEFPLEPFVTEQDNLRMIDVDADEGLGAKLDLAHAYIEIGEKESAKELLDEILQKGNAEQVAEVKIILDSLDK